MLSGQNDVTRYGQKKSRPEAALQTQDMIGSGETKGRTILLAAIGHEANASEAEDHHRPR
jgi:hypothetical protein